jgi:hypothetical protein
MKKILNSSLFVLAVILTVNGISFKVFAADKLLISSVQKILDEENLNRAKLDGRLVDAIKDLQTTNANRYGADALEMPLLRDESKINEVKDALSENHLRIEFLNMFISGLETASDVRMESPKILADLSHKELLAAVESGGETKVWLFELYLSIAIRDIMEPSENYADFVKKYMNYASLKEPKSPAGFMKDKGRNYLTGPEKSVRHSPTQE